MNQKNIPFNFVFDYLTPSDIKVRQRFGVIALYVDIKIVLILRQRKDHPETNRAWIPTSAEHHESLKKDFPSLRSVSIFADESGISTWQMLPAERDDFGSSVIKLCEFINHGDPRIGRIPKPRKSKKKTK